MQRTWVLTCASGLVVSASLLLGSVWNANWFMRAARDLTVERMRRDLQTYFDDETVSTIAARRFLESVPSGKGDFKLVDRDRMRELIRALGAPGSPPTSSRALRSARGTGGWQAFPIVPELDRRARELVDELRFASAACTLLFGLACSLFTRHSTVTHAPTYAARVATCGATLIGSGYVMTWHYVQGYAAPIILISTGVVLTLMGDALFNNFRATRAALDVSRFWP